MLRLQSALTRLSIGGAAFLGSRGLSAQVAGRGADGGATEIEESIRWLRMPPAWLIVLVVVPLVIAFVVFFYKRENPSGSRAWRWLLAALRVAVIGMALLLLTQPVRHKTIYEKTDSTFLVMVDDSLSMDLGDRYSDRDIPERIADLFRSDVGRIEESTRYELAQRLLRDPELAVIDKLRAKGKVAVATFARGVQQVGKVGKLREGESASAVEPAAPSEEDAGLADEEGVVGPGSLSLPPFARVRNDPRVQETRIAESLKDGVAGLLGSGFQKRRERVSGVLLLSDGQQNADSISGVDVARRLGERGTPVYTVGVGNPDEPKDVRVVNLDVNDIVLVDDTVPFDVAIVSEGFEGQEVRVELLFDSRLVDTEQVELGADGQQQMVRLEHQPQEPGKFSVTVRVEELDGEVFYDNNSVNETVTVLDQKIRVLYADFLPRWEYRFLKNALIRDKTMESQIWLFSADANFTQDSSPGVPPLTRFPRTREDIFSYHVIFLGDVDPEQHLDPPTIELLKEFVLEGGGLVFLCGPHFNPSSYLHTELYPLVPVEVAEGAGRSNPDRAPITNSFNVELTAVGSQHPLMRLDNDGERNRLLWENKDGQFYDHLPGFYWFSKSQKAKAGTVVLARHPEQMSGEDQRGFAIFAFMNYGKGKTFYSAVDDTWRWRAGVDNLYFYRFWGQVARFVASGRLLGDTQRYSIATDKDAYAIGETVSVECRVYDANLKPSTDPSVTVYWQVLGQQSDAATGSAVEEVELTRNELQGPGIYSGVVPANLRGQHDLWIGSESERLAFTSFNVVVPALESRDTRLNRAVLSEIARASGGQYFDFPEVLEAVDKMQGVTRSEAGLVENDDLWDERWIALLFTCIIASEWILRKMVRLV